MRYDRILHYHWGMLLIIKRNPPCLAGACAEGKQIISCYRNQTVLSIILICLHGSARIMHICRHDVQDDNGFVLVQKNIKQLCCGVRPSGWKTFLSWGGGIVNIICVLLKNSYTAYFCNNSVTISLFSYKCSAPCTTEISGYLCPCQIKIWAVLIPFSRLLKAYAPAWYSLSAEPYWTIDPAPDERLSWIRCDRTRQLSLWIARKSPPAEIT